MMAEYTVLNDGTPYFRWRQNTIKAREGNLGAGYKVVGTENAPYLIIQTSLPGAEEPPPYAMYLYAVTPVVVTPPPDPEPEPPPVGIPDTIYMQSHNVYLVINDIPILYNVPGVMLVRIP